MEHTIDLILPTSRDAQFKSLAIESGMTLVRSGQPLIGLITVIRGRLKRKRLFPSGEYLVGIAGPGERLGLAELLNGSEHLETLEAIGEVEVQVEPVAALEIRLRTVPPEVRRLLVELAWQQSSDMTKGVGLSRREKPSVYQFRRPLDLMPVKARVAATLWQLMQAHGVRGADGVCIDLDLTREEIAHLAGTVYESVIRMLTKFKKDGLIQLDGRRILIKDETLLARTAQVVLDRQTELSDKTDSELSPESVDIVSKYDRGEDYHDSRSDKEAVLENHGSKNNSRSKEAS